MNIIAEKILVIGDIHGSWGILNSIINKQRADIILQTGDFGIFPEIIINDKNFLDFRMDFNFDLKHIKQGDTKTKIFWVPGNHENWWALEKVYGRYGKEPIAMNDFIYYCPIGSTLQINNLTYLFIGGADSYDKNQRIIGRDWFPEELLNQKDIDYIFENVDRADCVISHTNPVSFTPKHFQSSEKISDPSRIILQMILEKYHPKYWAHSHWHNYNFGYDYDCSWVCLDYPNHHGRYYHWFDEKEGWK